MSKSTLIFIHGYSVTSFDTYGELPLRLRNEAKSRGEDLATEDIFLGRYISFNDEVLLQDVAKALEKAVSEQLPEDQPFIAVTHSTGGPLVRTWWKLFYQDQQRKCPMTHLIMLAPANHGSALAQLGKSKLSRVKTWVEGLEPGQGILNWLELGSNAAWDLNCDWIKNGTEAMRKTGVYPFVITGQNIDRKLYDHINSYTGEDGSDGVVRLASASLNSAYVKLEQEEPSLTNKKQTAPLLKQTEFVLAPASPFKVIQGKSHSGDEMGIMRSVKKGIGTDNSDELIFSFFECLDVDDDLKWNRVQKEFEAVTIKNQKTFEVEEDKSLLRNRTYLHDRYSQVIIRVRDQEGQAVTDFDLVMTGDEDQPDLLPNGFFKDRQCNLSHRNILTFYLNYDVLNGCEEKRSSGGEVVRPALKGCARLGFKIIPRPSAGFVRYLPCSIAGGKEFFNQLLRPNSTTLVEIVLQRVLSSENFRFEKLEGEGSLTLNYKNIKPGEEIV